CGGSPGSSRDEEMKSIICACAAFCLASVALTTQGPVRQAVVETSAGTFVIDLTPDTAPNQVAYFVKVAQEGGYDGTSFHTMVKNGMIQGGDPLTKDPA